MFENKPPQENPNRYDKPSQALTRPPLQALSHENLPKPVPPPNPQLVKLYSSEIFSFLESTEEAFQTKSDYFSLHTELSHTSRAFLIDWLVIVHQKFRLLQETLYIAVNLIDRYLSKRNISKKQLQLVGVSAIFIASKYEEIYPPNAKDFLMTTEQAYSKQHLVKMEMDMLRVVEFQVTVPTAWRLMERYAVGSEAAIIAEYLLELGLVEFGMVKYKPSVQAAAVVHLAGVLGSGKEIKNEQSDVVVKECVKEFYKIFKCAASHPLTAVREKYIKKKLDVAKLEGEA